MNKKIVGLLMAFALLLAGCSNAKTTSTPQTEKQTQKAEQIKPTEKTTEKATPKPTETPTPTPTETPEPATEAPAPEPVYTFAEMSATMYVQKSVNVRSAPRADSDKLGALAQNVEVAITGQCNETSWYRIVYKGSVGYVSDKYLDTDKVAVQQPSTETETESAQQPSTEATQQTTEKPAPVKPEHWWDGYEMNKWYDMGSYAFIITSKGNKPTEDTTLEKTILERHLGGIYGLEGIGEPDIKCPPNSTVYYYGPSPVVPGDPNDPHIYPSPNKPTYIWFL
jgi:uncharacterized protein YraI